MKIKLEIKGYPELLALHRVILEAKFGTYIQDEPIIGSPLVANIAERVIDTIIALEIEQGNFQAPDKWNEWRQIDPTRREWKAALQYIKNTRKYWDSLDNMQKRDHVRVILSPFLLSSDKLEEFIRQANHSSIEN